MHTMLKTEEFPFWQGYFTYTSENAEDIMYLDYQGQKAWESFLIPLWKRQCDWKANRTDGLEMNWKSFLRILINEMMSQSVAFYLQPCLVQWFYQWLEWRQKIYVYYICRGYKTWKDKNRLMTVCQYELQRLWQAREMGQTHKMEFNKW